MINKIRHKVTYLQCRFGWALIPTRIKCSYKLLKLLKIKGKPGNNKISCFTDMNTYCSCQTQVLSYLL